ncbi:MAG: hypothetical protein DWQ37_14325 [Planctomycetota bacterium]|nr:MAG: hypothetical protein DWQ37_14325 [Planctomycetota bacterium]
MTHHPRSIKTRSLQGAGLAFGLATVQLLMSCNPAVAQPAPATSQAPGAARTTPSQAAPSQAAPSTAAATDDGNLPARGAITSKLLRYAERIVERYDANLDGQLDPDEWKAMRGRPQAIDQDGDGRLTVDEFARHVANYGTGRRIRLATPRDPVAETAPPPTSTPLAAQGAAAETDPDMVAQRRGLKFFAPLPSGTPSWFVERDTDGDAQLTLAEYSPRLRSTEIAEFKKHDINGDGLITAAELRRAASPAPNATTPSGTSASP